MKIYKIIVFFVLTSLISCVNDTEGVVNINVEDLKKVIEREKNIQLLDVRFPSETKDGMILNALNVNLISNNFQSEVVNVLDKDKPVYVYCRSGNRSKIAAGILVDKGYEVFNVKGGYKKWLKENKHE